MKKFALLTNYSKDKRLVYTRMIKTYITEMEAATGYRDISVSLIRW